MDQKTDGQMASLGSEESSADKDDDDRESEFVEVDPLKRYGRYDEVLGKGAFKTVYRAFDEVEGIEVAWNQVKVQDVLQSPEDLERLYSEVHLLKTLRHKNIIKFYNSWVDTKTKNVNFITEIFTSGTLRQYRQKHKHCDLKAVKNWSRQILRGLLYLHSHDPPIIHRDLKCDNIFVNGNQGEVKIGDLGLAAILRTAHAAHSVIGTPEFMAPELYEEEYNELVDIYSFGMCLLEMVTFEYPYSECSNAAQIYKKVISGKKPAALDKVKDPDVRAFVEKCLATASRRLPARELLMDPFLKDDSNGDSSMPRVDSRTEDLGGASLASEDSVPRPLSLPDLRPLSNMAGPGRASGSDLKVVFERDPIKDTQGSVTRPESIHAKPELRIEMHVKGRNGSDFGRRVERTRSSRDFKVKGKKREDDEKIYLRLRIADAEGHVRNIHFPFDVEADTALSVASEMVAELDLSDQDVSNIAEMIDAEIMALVPDWRAGVAVEEASAAGGSDAETEGSQQHDQSGDEGEEEDGEEDDPDNQGTISSAGSLLSPAGRDRSFSPSRSRSRSHSRPTSRGLIMSPSRVSLGAASPPKLSLERGVSHGRFWEGFEGARQLPPVVFSSDESDENTDRIAICSVPEDAEESYEDAQTESPSSSVDGTLSEVSDRPIMEYAGELMADAGPEEKQELVDLAEVGELHRKGLAEIMPGPGEHEGTQPPPLDLRRKSLSNLSELHGSGDLRLHHGYRDVASPSPRLEHSRSEDVLAMRSGHDLLGQNGHGGEMGDDEGDDEDDNELMEQEERLREEREQALEELEKTYRIKLEQVRNRHRKGRGVDLSGGHSGVSTPEKRKVDFESQTGHYGREQGRERDGGRDREHLYREGHDNRSGKNGYHLPDRERDWDGDRVWDRDRDWDRDWDRDRDRERGRGGGRDRDRDRGRRRSPTPPLGFEYSGSGRSTPPLCTDSEEYFRHQLRDRETEGGYSRREREALDSDLPSGASYPRPRREVGREGEGGVGRQEKGTKDRSNQAPRESRVTSNSAGGEGYPSRGHRREPSWDRDRRSSSPLPSSLRVKDPAEGAVLRRENSSEGGRRSGDYDSAGREALRESGSLSEVPRRDAYHDGIPRSRANADASSYRESAPEDHGMQRRQIAENVLGRRANGVESAARREGREALDYGGSRRDNEAGYDVARRETPSPVRVYSRREGRERDREKRERDSLRDRKQDRKRDERALSLVAKGSRQEDRASIRAGRKERDDSAGRREGHVDSYVGTSWEEWSGHSRRGEREPLGDEAPSRSNQIGRNDTGSGSFSEWERGERDRGDGGGLRRSSSRDREDSVRRSEQEAVGRSRTGGGGKGRDSSSEGRGRDVMSQGSRKAKNAEELREHAQKQESGGGEMGAAPRDDAGDEVILFTLEPRVSLSRTSSIRSVGQSSDQEGPAGNAYGDPHVTVARTLSWKRVGSPWVPSGAGDLKPGGKHEFPSEQLSPRDPGKSEQATKGSQEVLSNSVSLPSNKNGNSVPSNKNGYSVPSNKNGYTLEIPRKPSSSSLNQDQPGQRSPLGAQKEEVVPEEVLSSAVSDLVSVLKNS